MCLHCSVTSVCANHYEVNEYVSCYSLSDAFSCLRPSRLISDILPICLRQIRPSRRSGLNVTYTCNPKNPGCLVSCCFPVLFLGGGVGKRKERRALVNGLDEASEVFGPSSCFRHNFHIFLHLPPLACGIIVTVFSVKD